MSRRKIVIFEDHLIIVQGLQSLFQTSEEFELFAHARTESELEYLLHQHQLDILILDLRLKDIDGFKVLEKVRSHYPQLRILILTMYDNHSLVQKAKQLKANGYVLKDISNSELVHALRSLEPDNFFLHDALKQPGEADSDDSFVDSMQLTKRELEIVRLLAHGKTNEEISEELFISYHTVRTHRKNLMKKLGVETTVDLVRFAYDNGLV